jgi:hypothetical protein
VHARASGAVFQQVAMPAQQVPCRTRSRSRCSVARDSGLRSAASNARSSGRSCGTRRWLLTCAGTFNYRHTQAQVWSLFSPW